MLLGSERAARRRPPKDAAARITTAPTRPPTESRRLVGPPPIASPVGVERPLDPWIKPGACVSTHSAGSWAGVARRPDILVLGINDAPEVTGVARDTTGVTRGLAAEGHRVQVLTGFPHGSG
jgi:hypothetical protein